MRARGFQSLAPAQQPQYAHYLPSPLLPSAAFRTDDTFAPLGGARRHFTETPRLMIDVSAHRGRRTATPKSPSAGAPLRGPVLPPRRFRKSAEPPKSRVERPTRRRISCTPTISRVATPVALSAPSPLAWPEEACDVQVLHKECAVVSGGNVVRRRYVSGIREQTPSPEAFWNAGSEPIRLSRRRCASQCVQLETTLFAPIQPHFAKRQDRVRRAAVLGEGIGLDGEHAAARLAWAYVSESPPEVPIARPQTARGVRSPLFGEPLWNAGEQQRSRTPPSTPPPKPLRKIQTIVTPPPTSHFRVRTRVPANEVREQGVPSRAPNAARAVAVPPLKLPLALRDDVLCAAPTPKNGSVVEAHVAEPHTSSARSLSPSVTRSRSGRRMLHTIEQMIADDEAHSTQLASSPAVRSRRSSTPSYSNRHTPLW